MKKQFFLGLSIVLLTMSAATAQKTVTVESFEKVIISPHIEVNFVAGDTESVVVESCSVSDDKLNIEVDGKTLRVYLDGAKNIPKNKKVYVDGHKMKKSLYEGTIVTATVNYKFINDLSLRGEEQINFQSEFDQDELALTIYGESEVSFESLKLEKLKTVIYGESLLEIKSGSVGQQKITAYGESRINMQAMDNSKTKLTAYGESEFLLNTSDQIRITAYGEATVGYRGNPDVKTGLTIGDVKIYEID